MSILRRAVSATKCRNANSRTLITGLGLALVLLATAFGAGSAQARQASLFPSFRGAVPVLLYHRLGNNHDAYTVTPATFEAQLQLLHDLGFEAITLDQYVAFMRGGRVALPQRPILITFDDAYASALKYGDPLLARFGWSATMYVPTAALGRPGHLTWGQLRNMEASGRWEAGVHAGNGHHFVTVDAAGRRGPFYTNEVWRNGRKETFSQYKHRVAGDLRLGANLLSRELPGRTYDTFAVPFNNYGQYGTNDPRIEPWFVRYSKTHFAVTFVQHDRSFTRDGQHFANRIAVGGGCDANALEARLLEGARQLKRVGHRVH
jgi:hypothetical protein